MSPIYPSPGLEPEHSVSEDIEQARESGRPIPRYESSDNAGSSRTLFETTQEHHIQMDPDKDIIELKKECPTLVDLTADGPYEGLRAAPSLAPIKDESEHQPTASPFSIEPGLEMTSNTHIPELNIEEDSLDLSGCDIDAHERAIESEAIAKRLEKAGFLFCEPPNVNQAARNPVYVSALRGREQDEPVIAESDEEDATAAAKFNDFRKKYERRKRRNMTSFLEDIEYTKACQAEDTRLRHLEQKRADVEHERKRQTREDSEDVAMFFPENTVVSRKPKKAGSSRIPAKIFEESMRIGRHAGSGSAAKSSKAPRKPRDPTKKVTEDRVAKPKNGGRDVAKSKSRRSKKQYGPQMTNIVSLYHDDIIADALANRGREAQPTFSSTTRREALQELIASVPEEQHLVALADKRALDEACKSFTGRGAMSADGKGGWLLKGMRTSLYHYQLLGAAFMRERENAARRPFGGLQSDSMGLGKTVMTIANIVDGSVAIAPHQERDLARTTLIVCPAGLCSQWFTEITKHCLPGTLEVSIYRPGSRMTSSNLKKVLESSDVVITSYQEILRSYPFADAPKHLSTEQEKNKWWKEHYENNVGPLHQINWRRIVLDEAQQIKSRTSKTFKSVCALAGKFRWAMSGTPIQNKLDELFPFFSFLKVEHTGSYETFKHNYLRKGSESALKRLHSQLRSFMIRRTHRDQIFDRPLLLLPDIDRKTITVEFNDCERAIYRIVHKRFFEKIRAWTKAGHLERSYQSVFVLFLRLRQLVSHILLIQRTLTELLLAEDLEKLWRITKVEQMPAAEGSVSVLSQLKKMLVRAKQTSAIHADDNHETQSQEVASDSVALNYVDDSPTNVDRPFDTAFKFRRYLQLLKFTGKWDEINSRSLCHKCGSVPEDPHLTSCQHLYCKECLSVLLYTAEQKGEENAMCLACDSIFQGSAPCRGFEEAGDSINPLAQEPSATVRRSSSISTDEDISWITSGERMLPSAKTTGCKAQILAWIEAEPDCKIIIFSQFMPMLRILERICREERWKYEQFHGSMSYEARDKAIQHFSDEKGPMILLASLKAGGSGLNLVMASKVLLVDLWWNISVEDQAFCRVFRIGQTKRVEVTRLVVKDTIDEDIMAMQEYKKTQIDSVMEAENQPGRLTTNELLKLFGPLQIDPQTGQMEGDEGDEDSFIFVEDECMNDDSSDRDAPIKTPARPF